MWFAKLFGGLRRSEADDEPARHAPPASAKTVQPVRRARKDVSQNGIARGVVDQRTGATTKKGFDPYNSGSFDRNAAWERTRR